MLQVGVDYAIDTYRYEFINDHEFTGTQVLILSLLNTLVTGDVTSCYVLAKCSHNIQQLRSRHLGQWLREDFNFPHKDVEVAMTTLDVLLDSKELDLPSHVLRIFSSLANLYGITLKSQVCLCNYILCTTFFYFILFFGRYQVLCFTRP